jgi:hypothetical protein
VGRCASLISLPPGIFGYFYYGTFEGQYIHGVGIAGILIIGVHLYWTAYRVGIFLRFLLV